jgi:hypothetical protein
MEIGKMLQNMWKHGIQKVINFFYQTLFISYSLTIFFTECKEHYCDRFVTGTIGKLTWQGLPNGLLASGESRLAAIDHTCPDNAPLSPSITSRLPPLAIQPEETLELGYMPQRDDFERVGL